MLAKSSRIALNICRKNSVTRIVMQDSEVTALDWSCRWRAKASSTAPAEATLEQLVFVSKVRWRIERDHQDLKAGIWPGAPRRPRVARPSSSRHAKYRGLCTKCIEWRLGDQAGNDPGE